MDFSECIQFANENPVTYIATMDGDQPRVRAFAMWFADESGFYYHTSIAKNVWKQLTKNPNVELCFFAPGDGAGKMMRVAGSIEPISEIYLREKLIEDRPWLLDIGITGAADPKLVVFRIAHGEAYFWTMEYNMREAEAPRVTF